MSIAMSDESLIGKTEELRKKYEETQALGEELNIAVKLPDLEGEDSGGDKPHKDCYVGWRDFFLGSDGYVRSCMSTSEKLFKIDKYSSFDEMWNSPEYQKFRAKVNSNNMCGACSRCYQSAAANWNKEYAFDQRGLEFAPEWEKG